MIEVFFDGSCFPVNPCGKMGVAFKVFRNGDCVFTQSLFFNEHESNTSNLAEHIACNLALDYLVVNKLTKEPVYFFGDSRLVINQLNESWKVNYPNVPYALFCFDSLDMKRLFSDISFSWIPREYNGEVDALTKDDEMPKYYHSTHKYIENYFGITFDFKPKVVSFEKPKKRKKMRYFNPTVKKKVI